MSDNLIMLCVVIAAVAIIAIPFIRRAIRHRKAIGANVSPEELTMEVQPNALTPAERYLMRYLLTYTEPFVSSKTVRIRPEYVDKIKNARRIIRGGKTTVTAYVDKVLEAHFEKHTASINKLNDERSGEMYQSRE